MSAMLPYHSSVQGNTQGVSHPSQSESRQPWLPSMSYPSQIDVQGGGTGIVPHLQGVGSITTTPSFYNAAPSTKHVFSASDSTLTRADTAWMNALFNQADQGIPQQGGNLTATLPFNEAAGLHNNPSVASYANTFDPAWRIQQGQGHLLVQPPQQVGNPIFPTVVRQTISTPAIIASADSRRVHRRKHACWICDNKFTSKANRDRHLRAHFGIKPFICACGKSFTARADLHRHRKGAKSCPE